MDVVLIIGRVLFGLIFLGGGTAGHLAQADATAGYAATRGLKNAKPLVQISGVLMIAGALGVLLGIWADLAALGLVAYVLISNFLIHHFWSDSDAMARQMEMTQFMKNLAIAGGGLIIFALADQIGPTITDPLF